MAGRAKLIENLTGWLLAALFLYAGSFKLLHPDALLNDIQSYNLVPYRMAYLGAYLLPALEIAAALGLCIPRLRLESVWIVTVLTVVFIVALASAWGRGIDISCGCFGKAEAKANYPLLIGRDILILIACGVVIRLSRLKKS